MSTSTNPRAPACMTAAEAKAWWAANRTIHNIERSADSPCEDCSRIFAETMRLVKQCDGTWPGEGTAPEGLHKIGRSGQWAYPTEEARVAARRATWRESSRRRWARAMA